MRSSTARTKHHQVFSSLRREIESGQWRPGDRIPSEAALVDRFGVSRITVGRAVRDLQQAGLVNRRAGAGTFVTAARALTFGLLIPDYEETEIFEPICQALLASPQARDHALMWGSDRGEPAISKAEGAWHLCAQYIERRVSGVFFAPIEATPERDAWNRRIGEALDAARIPVVLLDRAIEPYPDPGHHDVVGIDNRRAGYQMTAHLLGLGCRRVAFIGPPHAASTVDARQAGYREALFVRNVTFEAALVRRMNPDHADAVATLMQTARPDAIACANDRLAARLLRTLASLGHAIPADVRVVGIDDVDYARLLPVPLTTLRQPTRAIGETALALMLQRVAQPTLPPRHVHLHGDLIVRDSCGSPPDRPRAEADPTAGGGRA